MGYAYDESPFAPLRTTTSGTSLPDKDAEIARLRAELDAWKSRFRALVDADSPDSAGNEVIALQRERDEANADCHRAQARETASILKRERLAADLAAARAALDKEREACDEWRTLYADAVDPRKVRSDPYGAQQNANAQRLAMMHDARRAAEAKEPPR